MTPQEARKAHNLSPAMRRVLVDALHADGQFTGAPMERAVLTAHGYIEEDPWGDGMLLTRAGEDAARRFAKLQETDR